MQNPQGEFIDYRRGLLVWGKTVERDNVALYALTTRPAERNNAGRSSKRMLLFIIVSVVAAVVAIGAYQLLLQKYYWGPKGPPKKDSQTKDPRRR
jgi:hypothetical protein